MAGCFSAASCGGKAFSNELMQQSGIAPPSHNGNGASYHWLKDLKVSDVKPARMPSMLADTLRSGGGNPSERVSALNKDASFKKGRIPYRGRNIAGDSSPAKTATDAK